MASAFHSSFEISVDREILTFSQPGSDRTVATVVLDKLVCNHGLSETLLMQETGTGICSEARDSVSDS